MARSMEATAAEFETYPMPPTEEEWLELRKPWWNASLAACVFGEHEYVSLGDACTEKLRSDFKVIDEDTARMFRRGVDLEPYVAQEVHNMTGLTLARPGVLYRRGRLMTTLDFEVDDWRHVEIKTTTKFLGGVLPRYWYWQAQAQMWCRDTETTIFGVLEGPRLEVSIFEVDRDDDAIVRLIGRVDSLMAAIDFGELPPGVELSAENVTVLYPRDSGTTVDLPDEVVQDVAAYEEARTQEASWKEEKMRLRDRVVTRMGPASFAAISGVQVASYKASRDQEVFDEDRFRQEHPEMYAQYLETKPGSRRFVIRPKALTQLAEGAP